MRLHLKYALRTLLKHRGFTAAAVLMLAIGIGANTAMFSIVRAVLLRPLGFEPNRVVMLWPRNVQRSHAVGELAFRDYVDLRQRTHSFEKVALLGSVNWSGALRIGSREPVVVPMNAVSATFFDTLGARPLLGRTFRPDEDDPTAPRVLVLSHGLWVRLFDADPAAIGRTVTVKQGAGEELFEIVGVMPPEFFFPRGAQYWTPAAAESGSLARRDGNQPDALLTGLNVFHAIGRLKPGTTLAQASAETNTLVRALFAEQRMDPTGTEMVLTRIVDHIFGSARPALQVLMGAVVVVLLIACTNLASLLLARGAGRRREIAVRAALGAGRSRLIGQLFAESALLALAGTVIGVTIAALSLNVLVALSPADIPRLDATSFDRGVFTFAVAMAVLTTLILGLAPAWQLTSSSVVDDLKGDATGVTGRSTSARTRRTLVTLQIAATLVLLIAAGLCIQSFERLNRIDLGFDPTNVLTFAIDRLEERYPDVPQRTHAVEQLLARFERVPHVIAAGAVLQRPFEHGAIGMDSGFVLEGQPLTPDTFMRNPMLNWESVTPGYFRAMGIRLLRGRHFDERDTAASPLVVIVSESMASRVWPGEDAIGKRLSTAGAQGDNRPIQWQTVVGVVESARYREIESPRLDIYVPLRQAESFVNHYIVRTALEPAAVAATLKAETAAFDGALTLGSVKTMEEIVARTKGPWRFNMLVFSMFGLVALGLAGTGLFALIAYAVAQRTREIGVRIALGAAPADVIRLMLAEGAALAGIGVACGLIAAALLTRLLSGLLFDISATDPATFATVSALLIAVAALASYLPARRAAAVDPLVALRAE
jgi:putative ABC transport system permease protein